MKTKILLVAGYNYSNPSGTNYATYCTNRMNYLLHHNPSWATDNQVEFYRFLFQNGTIDKNTAADRSRWQEVNHSFTAIDRSSHYDGNDFRSSSNNVMSMTDIYDFVIESGQNEPNSILELSIFSHGWFGGPVLVNSYERSAYHSSPERDPQDKDGRTKDGNLTNMNFTRWMHFTNAFHANGRVWSWGCSFPRLLYSVLHKTFSVAPNKKTRVSQYTDSDMLEFTYRQEQADDYYYLAPLFFPGPYHEGDRVTRSDLKFNRTFEAVKQLFKAFTLHSYLGLMAYDTGIPFIGAFPGTYSIFEQAPINSRRRMMIIERQGTFSKIIDFYKIHLGLLEDPDGKGFAIFSPSTMDAWKTELSSPV